MTRSYVCPECDGVIELDLRRPAGIVACPLCAEDVDAFQLLRQSPQWVEQVRATQTPPETGRPKAMPSNEAFVTDVVLGPNLRMKDNLIQGLAILGAMLIGLAVGPLFTDELVPGMLVGAFVGMVAGLLLSGVALMIYRLFHH